ncbi:MAG: HD domain-containing phosphohydrolase, partial [Thermoleophilia bacterium]
MIGDSSSGRRSPRSLDTDELAYRSLFEHMLDGTALCRMIYDESGSPVDFVYLDVNPAFGQLTGLADVVGKRVSEVIPGIRTANPELFEVYGKAALTGEQGHLETYVAGVGLWLSLVVYSPRKDHFIAVFEDVSERKRAEWEADRVMDFLGLLNDSQGADDLANRAVTFLFEHSGCDAIGVRLRDGHDYPYFETQGFSSAFLEAENSLCGRDKGDDCLAAGACEPVLDCMCGNVIRGRFDPAQPFFTATGSFWSNATTKLLAATTPADRLAHTRNRCNGDGYESVLLVPLRTREQPIGLLQLNARREDAFSAAAVALWERLAGHLAVALAKVRAEEGLRDLTGRLGRSLTGMVAALGATVEMRDPYTAGHQQRVGELSQAIATALGWSDERIETVHVAALLHDVGKVVVPAEILAKPLRLSDTELSIIRVHAGAAREILGPIEFTAPITEIVVQHHERLDGSGYPEGLRGEAILPEARVLAVADVYEA